MHGFRFGINHNHNHDHDYNHNHNHNHSVPHFVVLRLGYRVTSYFLSVGQGFRVRAAVGTPNPNIPEGG